MSAVCTTSTLALLQASRPVAVPPAVRRGAWQLAAGQAISLKAASASLLRVRQGRVWVTRDATRPVGQRRRRAGARRIALCFSRPAHRDGAVGQPRRHLQLGRGLNQGWRGRPGAGLSR